MEIAYFLGCIMPNRYPGIEKATRILFEALDIELKDMNGASCCPAPGVFGSFDEETWATIAARNLTLAEDMGADIMTECNGCFGSLFEANHMLKEDEDKRAKINENLSEIGREFKGTTNVKHLAQILRDDIGFEKISSLIEKPLDLNVAVHYGCHFLKPTDEIGIEEQAENPTILDELVELTGAKSIDYKDKMMCCGAGGGVRSRDLDVTASYTKEKLDNMSKAGVDAIIDVCPFCHMQFDQGQTEVNERYGTDFSIPVFHLAQLYGLAMGLSAEDLTLDAQKIDAAPALAKALGENAK
ncbi:CoB--CoM heterodisulfide reductase subunit B [uncultured Methanobrevibacter sp.]|uniref:CoB--CoM heterodisulfide reductase subunit B n=1 Tax=uncultured Methanobrevibacter sp. TaxID=253161 RepID=UPI0025D45077|nr:CoB--CoM heterodisulfide reductase subunit B [uncultured Methanobrevibacter sp.]